MPTLQLGLTDYLDATRWRWTLSDGAGRFLADHEVHLDSTSREYAGFCEPGSYLDYHQAITPPEAQLAELGDWIGEQVFGDLRDALWEHRAAPAVAVQVSIPPQAEELLLRPFELARFAGGTSFLQAGLRFVYQLAGAPGPSRAKREIEEKLRILAAFSLPDGAKPLNLRRERYGLQRLARELSQVRGRAVELRVLQYGATRASLRDALEEGTGWDIIHLSGHGNQGELLLEDERGVADVIRADELGELLELTKARLKLLILDACYSGAGSHAAARAQLGLEREPTRQAVSGTEGAGEALEEMAPTVLPSLAQALAGRLDCAALAMRYPVGDAFATDLMLALYLMLLDRGQPLPAALHLALGDALAGDVPRPPLSPATPILVGARAADLKLAPPLRPHQPISLPQVGLGIAFPSEPERFVGRLGPMLRASQALAPHSPMRGVLFYGMPGAGKTACALELAYRHAEGRFQGYVWYRAPEAGSEVAGELFNLLFEIERQLNAPGLGLTTALDEPERFRGFTLPRLRALLGGYSLLLVLDNLETLLTGSGNWRDPLWGDVVAALLGHDGPSRAVFTSRRLPAGLADHPGLQVEPMHALSLAESVLLARELPHLRRLFDDEAGQELLYQTLRVVQGHPKLLELADGLAGDRAALAARVAAAADDIRERAGVLDAFFAAGGPREGESRQDEAGFVRALRGWTERLAGDLPPAAGLLLACLCRLEPEDRLGRLVETVWPHVLTRLGEDHPAAAAAQAEPAAGLPAALDALGAAGLVAAEGPDLDPAQVAGATRYAIHPGVAEAARAAADPAALQATDVELGDFHIAMFMQALKGEMQGKGGMVVGSARRAAPYLLRQARWAEASTLLEDMLLRDRSPSSLAFALPLLRRVAEASAGGERELTDAGVLATTLRLAGRTTEAEGMLRDLMARAAAGGSYHQASTAASELLNLLMSGGRLAEALKVAEEKAGYTRQAGLGPWTQLADETRRLQVLAAMGQYDKVLAAVEELRPQMEALPLESEADETVDPWNVRETLLNIGCKAAVYSGRWEVALALNAESVGVKQARGAGALDLARARFNDYRPLLALGRTADGRALLLECRAVFEAERDIEMLGKVYSALAYLEDESGSRAAAVRFEEVALGYKYQAGEPQDCAVSHHNLANYLERQGADPQTVLAHRLAAAAICLQMRSGLLFSTLRNLANSDLPAAPPAFAEVVERVEAVEGVRFRALFEHLPHTALDGDAAIAGVWGLVAEEKRRREAALAESRAEAQRLEGTLAALPEAVRTAFELEGEAFSAALGEALAELPEDEAQAVLQQLREAELIEDPTGPDVIEVPEQFEPLLQAIAAAATDERQRTEIDPLLARLEENGWMLSEPARRIWAGERDAAALTQGLDEQDSALVRRVLELLEA
jgi:hypothetical protein